MKRFSIYLLILAGLTACGHRRAKQTETTTSPAPAALQTGPAGPQTAAPTIDPQRATAGTAPAADPPPAFSTAPSTAAPSPDVARETAAAPAVPGSGATSDVAVREPRMTAPQSGNGADREKRTQFAADQQELAHYVQRAESRLHENEKRLLTLKRQADRHPIHSRARLRALYQARQAENDIASARRELHSLKRDIHQSWAGHKQQIDKRMSALDRSLEGIEAE